MLAHSCECTWLFACAAACFFHMHERDGLVFQLMAGRSLVRSKNAGNELNLVIVRLIVASLLKLIPCPSDRNLFLFIIFAIVWNSRPRLYFIYCTVTYSILLVLITVDTHSRNSLLFANISSSSTIISYRVSINLCDMFPREMNRPCKAMTISGFHCCTVVYNCLRLHTTLNCF